MTALKLQKCLKTVALGLRTHAALIVQIPIVRAMVNVIVLP